MQDGCNLTIMPFVYFRHILQTAVTNDFGKCMLVDQSKKKFCNICGYCFVEWWIKPNNISKYFLVLWFLFFGLVDDLINYECKEAYRLAFCMDNKFHFAK